MSHEPEPTVPTSTFEADPSDARVGHDVDRAVRVVVTDDHDDLRMVLRMLLAADGRFDVVGEGATGEDALALVEERRPDLLLLDVAMPRMDGLVAIEECLRRSARSPVIVVLSGHTAATMERHVLDRGAARYLEKTVGLGTTIADSVYGAWQAARTTA